MNFLLTTKISYFVFFRYVKISRSTITFLPPCKNENFANTSQKLAKNSYSTRPGPSFKYPLTDCTQIPLQITVRRRNALNSSNVLTRTVFRSLEDVFKMSWRRHEDILKMFWRGLRKAFWKRLGKMSWTRLEDVLATSWKHLENVLWRRMSKANMFALVKISSSRQIFAGSFRQ